METEQAKIYHHHTPRYYLLPWTDADECIGWMGFGKVNRSGLTVVGGENHFYRLHEVTEHDKLVLRHFSTLLNPGARNVYDRILKVLTVPYDLKRFVENSDNPDEELIRIAELAIHNTNEDKHHEIEKVFRPFLNAMRDGDASFYDDEQSANAFIYSLCVQYFRTRQMKQSLLAIQSAPFDSLEGVTDILSHLAAASSADSLVRDRKEFKIVLIENTTAVPFITSDQPVVNLCSDPTDPKAPERLEFYLAVTPSRAMLFLEKRNPLHTTSKSISIDEAHAYNVMIIGHHGDRVFSNSDEYLKHLFRSATS